MLPVKRRGVMAGICGGLVALLFVSVATSDEVSFFDQYPEISLARWQLDPSDESLVGIDADFGEDEPDVVEVWQIDIPDAVRVVLLVLLAAGAVALLVMMWRRRPRLRWRRAQEPVAFDVLDDLALLVEADAAAQREALAVGTPRNAIVACWLRLETVTAEAGFDRDPADTSEEFTTRVLRRFAVDPAAVGQLAELYRKARFSSHEMGERDRLLAVEALDAVHRGLRASPAPVEVSA